MKYAWVFRIAGVVLLLVGIAGVAYAAYTAGANQAQLSSPIAVSAEEAEAVRIIRPTRGFLFLPGLLCLAPFFLCLFVFLPLRMLFGPHPMRSYAHGRFHPLWNDMSVPPPVEEWHRRMHEEKKAGG
ncbi:MAG: hypothetical protein JW929_13855 [Anaerolineales bacterium]|nr:hypothetical protein [Anaerolineales bacterium]